MNQLGIPTQIYWTFHREIKKYDNSIRTALLDEIEKHEGIYNQIQLNEGIGEEDTWDRI